MTGKTIEIKNLETQQGAIYTVDLSRIKTVSRGIYSIQYTDGRNNATVRIVK